MIGVDSELTATYKSALEYFVGLCRDTIEKGDSEYRNRSELLLFACRVKSKRITHFRRRLLGIAALTGVVTSDALYHASSEFAAQVSIIIPSILRILRGVNVDILTEE